MALALDRERRFAQRELALPGHVDVDDMPGRPRLRQFGVEIEMDVASESEESHQRWRRQELLQPAFATDHVVGVARRGRVGGGTDAIHHRVMKGVHPVVKPEKVVIALADRRTNDGGGIEGCRIRMVITRRTVGTLAQPLADVGRTEQRRVRGVVENAGVGRRERRERVGTAHPGAAHRREPVDRGPQRPAAEERAGWRDNLL